MEQGVTAVIMTMLIVLVFIPAIYLGSLQASREKVNDAMYLASRCLEDCVLNNDSYTLEEIAQGYALSEDPIMRIRIDEGKLFTQFDYVLYKNIGNIEEYSRIANNILCKILVYPDRYVVWDDVATASYFVEKGNASTDTATQGYYYYSYDEEYDEVRKGLKDVSVTAPKYFVYKNVNDSGTDKAEKLYKVNATGAVIDSGYFYINAINDKVRKFGDTRSWRNIDTYITQYQSGYSHNMNDYNSATGKSNGTNKEQYVTKKLTTYDKNQVIIETLNKEISYYTGGVKMDFINPASTVEKNLKATKKDFNFFEGISLIVIYKQPSYFNVSDTTFNFSQYTAAGYTLEN